MSAAVWANIISAISATFAGVSAVAARAQAKRSATAVVDAESALALILRPELVPELDGSLDDTPIGLSNVARHDAQDVRVLLLVNGKEVGSGRTARLPGQVPHVWAADADFRITATGLPQLVEVGASYDLSIIATFTDEQGSTKWRQELMVTRTLHETFSAGKTIRLLRNQNHLKMPTRT